MIASLTSFERDLLRTLTRRICILTLSQIASGWWPAIRRLQAVRQQLRRLEVAGLVEVDCINAHPLLAVDRPLFAWQPGQPDPDVEVISRATRERWNQAAVPTWVCVALPRAANLFGSTACGLPKMEQRDHDLRLSAVYLHYRKQHPQLARRWVGEHARPKGWISHQRPRCISGGQPWTNHAPDRVGGPLRPAVYRAFSRSLC